MDEKNAEGVQDAAVPLCEEFFQAAFTSLESMAPHWKERGVDVYTSQLLFARVLFHFACFPIVLMIQVMYKRIPEDTADEVLNVVLDMFVPVLVTHFLDIAELEGSEHKTIFRDEFVNTLQLQIQACLKHDHARGCAEFAALMSLAIKDIYRDDAPAVAKVVEETFPPMLDAYAQQMVPVYVKLATTFVDAVVAA